jgi:putative ABC transport system permease protein
MLIFLRLFRESLIFSIQALILNKLRTFLSLLGITIGIFAIIAVFTLVDTMENSIRQSVSSLGDDVIFIQKWPWATSNDYPWWKYWQRPDPSTKEYELLKPRLTKAEAVAFLGDTRKTVEFKSKSLENVEIKCVSQDYGMLRSLVLVEGRYFTQPESVSGRNLTIIGHTIAEQLFPNTSPIGKTIKIAGNKVQVIGVLEREGESLLGNSTDGWAIIPVNFAKNIFDLDRINPSILVKAAPNVSNDELMDDIRSSMRPIRKLRPKEDDNFAMNESSLLSSGLDDLFKLINRVGIIIGGFSILVGGFSIANIMFVSVKERTPLIGIQKSLGAKNYFILFQFLFEAVILSLFGGLIGLGFIYLGTLLASLVSDTAIILSTSNVIIGVMISVCIGLVSGIIPAWIASRLNPVDAIRAN